MLGYLTDSQILGTMLIVLSVLGAITVVVLYLFSRKEQKRQDVIAVSEWQPTNKIDFHCAGRPIGDKLPAPFLLRVEESRKVQSISGVEHTEIRWRNASLADAKAVVVAHQSFLDSAIKGHPVPKLVRS